MSRAMLTTKGDSQLNETKSHIIVCDIIPSHMPLPIVEIDLLIALSHTTIFTCQSYNTHVHDYDNMLYCVPHVHAITCC